MLLRRAELLIVRSVGSAVIDLLDAALRFVVEIMAIAAEAVLGGELAR